MDTEKYTAYLEQRDKETRPKRVDRLSKFDKITYGAELPERLWDYITQKMKAMYVDGHFAGSIVFATAIVESTLNDKLKGKLGMTDQESEDLRLTLAQTTLLCEKLGIINRDKRSTIDRMRKSRNELVHIDKKKTDREETDIDDEAPEYVKFTRNLCSKLYPEEQE